MVMSRKTLTASSSSLRTETGDQSRQLNVCLVGTYSEKVFPSHIRRIDSFSKKGKTSVKA